MEIEPEDLDLPDHAEEDEAAAIAAAIGTYLTELARAHEAGGEAAGWDGKRWTFAGRIESLTHTSVRVTDGAPTDPWTAAGRRDRM